MKLRNFNACTAQAKAYLQQQCAEKGHIIDLLEITEQAEICLLDENHFQITYATDDFQTYIVAEIEGDKLTFIDVEFQNYEQQ